MSLYGKRCACGVELTIELRGVPVEALPHLIRELEQRTAEHARTCKRPTVTLGSLPRAPRQDLRPRC